MDYSGEIAIADDLLILAGTILIAYVCLIPLFTSDYQADSLPKIDKIEFSQNRYISKNRYINKTVAKADAQIKQNVKIDSPTHYWAASKINGVVYLNPEHPLTLIEAVERVQANQDDFAVTKTDAEIVAYLAGSSASPMHHPPHRQKIGFYSHFHTNNHSENSHVWYLFG